MSRPNRITTAIVVLLSVLAWVQLFGTGPGSFVLPGGHSGATHVHALSHASELRTLCLALFMWLLMAVAMMLPTALPAILSFADLAQAGRHDLSPTVRIGGFAVGYLVAWSGFGVLATGAQWILARVAAQTIAFPRESALVAGGVLLLAGFYQFSRLKDLCLTECRSPMMFFLARWRDGLSGALYLGLRHGIHCVGCCWALMVLMLLAGAMNIGWMAALTAVMLIEKTFSAGRAIGRAVGLVLVLCGGTLVGAALMKGDLL